MKCRVLPSHAPFPNDTTYKKVLHLEFVSVGLQGDGQLLFRSWRKPHRELAVQRRGRLLCPRQLPDKEHRLLAVDKL